MFGIPEIIFLNVFCINSFINMKKQIILSASVGLLVACQQQGNKQAEQKGQEKPNILFLFADDQRFNTIHALGNDEIITPNLDKLVQNGTTFENAYINGSYSGAVSMPSRAMLLTGRNLNSLERQGRVIPDEHKLIGATLRENGYNCFGTGKWHNGKAAFNRCFNYGKEIFLGGIMILQANMRIHDIKPKAPVAGMTLIH
ncbi:MAG: sulfatase-like hydrolase/transferase [Bacteroidota bacterium]